MIDKAKASLKYLRSFAKSNWRLSDYPLRYRQQKPEVDEEFGRLELPAWSVQIVNWWQMTGLGNTREEAYKDLEAKLEKRQAEGKELPRPGTGLPIEFAPINEVAKYDDFAPEFFENILDFDYSECMITDESSLWDFHGEDSNEHLIQKILAEYGVDVSDIEDAKLHKIFKRIREG